MSRSRYTIIDQQEPHFVTCTVHQWAPVFTRPETVEVIADSLRFLQEDGRLVIYGYVIMINHVHLLASSPGLTEAIGHFKSFTAKQVLRVLREGGARTLVWQLTCGTAPRNPQRLRHLWRPGSHPEQIVSEEMMRQKLTYIHENPVRRGYVDDPVHWRYSRARNYAGTEGLIPVQTDWRK